jgi:pimeloyl-ACP methyl ester carboxylesterase
MERPVMIEVDRFLEANGIRQHVIEHVGTGPILLLMPGLTANARFFDGLVHAGLSPEIRVMAVDLRGRGETDQPDSGYTMADHGADIVALLDQLEIERVVLGGHSFGGLLTYYVAAHWPERVSACVVIDAPAAVDSAVVEQIQPSLDRLDTTFASWNAYLEFAKAMPYYANGWWDPHLEAFYRSDVADLPDGGVRPVCHPDHMRQAVEATMTPDWPGVVARIAQPTLLLRAVEPFGPPGSPPILDEDAAQQTVEAMPDARLVDLPGNHITALFGESARTAAQSIVEFVTEVAHTGHQ